MNKLNKFLLYILFSIFIFLPLLLISSYKIIDPYNSVTLSVVEKSLSLGKISPIDSISTFNPYDEGHIGYEAIIMTLSLVTDMSPKFMEVLPIGGLIIAVIYFIFIKKLFNSSLLAALSSIFIVYDPSLSPSQYNFFAYGMERPLLLIFFIMAIKILEKNRKVEYNFVMLLIYVGTFSIYWTTPVIMILFLFGTNLLILLQIIFDKQKKDLKTKLSNDMTIIFIIIYMGYSKVIYNEFLPAVMHDRYGTATDAINQLTMWIYSRNNETIGQYSVNTSGSQIQDWILIARYLVMLIPVVAYILFKSYVLIKERTLDLNLDIYSYVMWPLLFAGLMQTMIYAMRGHLSFRYLFLFLLPVSLISLIRLKFEKFKLVLLMVLVLLVISGFIYLVDKDFPGLSKTSGIENGAHFIFDKSDSNASILTDINTFGMYLIEGTLVPNNIDAINLYNYTSYRAIVNGTNPVSDKKSLDYIVINKVMAKESTMISEWRKFQPLSKYFARIDNNTYINKIYDDDMSWIFSSEKNISTDMSYIYINSANYHLSISRTSDRVGRLYNFYLVGTDFDYSKLLQNGILQNEYQNISQNSFTSLQYQHPKISVLYNNENTTFIKIDVGMPGGGINITEYFIFWKDLPYFYYMDKRSYLRNEILQKNNDLDILWHGSVFDEVASENVTGGLQVINISNYPTADWQYIRGIEPIDLEHIKNKFAWYNYRNIGQNISLGGILLKQNPLFHGQGTNFNVGLRNVSINPKVLPYNEVELTGMFKKPGYVNISDPNYNYESYEMIFYINQTDNFIISNANSLFSKMYTNFTENYHYAFSANGSDYYIRAPGIYAKNNPDVNSYDNQNAPENDITVLFKSWQIDVDDRKNLSIYNSSSIKMIGQNNESLIWINDWPDYTATISMLVNNTNTVKYIFNLTSKKNDLKLSNYKIKFYRPFGNIGVHWANMEGITNMANVNTIGNDTLWVDAKMLNWASFEYNVSGEPFQTIFRPEFPTISTVQRLSNHIEYWMYPYPSIKTLNNGQSDIKVLYVTQSYNTTIDDFPVIPTPNIYKDYYYEFPNHVNVIFNRFDENIIPLQEDNTFLIYKKYIVYINTSRKLMIAPINGAYRLRIIDATPGNIYTLKYANNTIENITANSSSIIFDKDIMEGSYYFTESKTTT